LEEAFIVKFYTLISRFGDLKKWFWIKSRLMPQNISQKNYFFFRFWRAIFYWSS